MPETNYGPFTLTVTDSAGTATSLAPFSLTVTSEEPPIEPYVGNIATGIRIPTDLTTSNKEFNSRSTHIARDDVTRLKVVLPNWLWRRTSGANEQNPGFAIIYEASVEYPEGTFTRITFSGGSNSISVPNGSQRESDWCNVAIPNGARFWIRVFGDSTGGFVFNDGEESSNSDQRDDANGEAMEYGGSNTQTSKVMGGDIGRTTNTVGSPMFGPVAIVAETTKPTLYIAGDSREWGSHELFGEPGNEGGYRGQVATAVGDFMGYINCGSAGDVITPWLGSGGSKRRALAQYCSHVIWTGGINDIRSSGNGLGRTGAAMIADVETLKALFPGKIFMLATLMPDTASTNGFIDAAGQSKDTNDAERVIYNDWVRTQLHFDIADVLETSRNSGILISNGEVEWITTDGLHLNAKGKVLLKNAQIFAPGDFTLQ